MRQLLSKVQFVIFRSFLYKFMHFMLEFSTVMRIISQLQFLSPHSWLGGAWCPNIVKVRVLCWSFRGPVRPGYLMGHQVLLTLQRFQDFKSCVSGNGQDQHMSQHHQCFSFEIKCVYVYVCLDMWVHMQMEGRSQHWALLIQLDSWASKLQGSSCVCLPGTMVTVLCLTFLCECLGFELRFSCLYDKHFTKQAFSSACTCFKKN